MRIWPPGGNTVDPENEKQAIFRSAMRQWKRLKDESEDNGVQRKIINERAHSEHTGGNVVQRQSMI